MAQKKINVFQTNAEMLQEMATALLQVQRNAETLANHMGEHDWQSERLQAISEQVSVMFAEVAKIYGYEVLDKAA